MLTCEWNKHLNWLSLACSKSRYWEQIVSFYYEASMCYIILPTNLALLLITFNFKKYIIRIAYGLHFRFLHSIISDFSYTGNPETAFTYFWITDSCPLTVKEVMHRPPFEVLSLASSISASLQIWRLQCKMDTIRDMVKVNNRNNNDS
jgi:hypothetical protein